MKKATNLNIENQVFGKWLSVIRVVDKFSQRVSEDISRQTKYILAGKILFACGNDESLPSFDLRIYESYLRIIGSYRSFVSIYLETAQSFQIESLKEIWNGIYSVLVSRLLVNSDKQPEPDVNPLLVEKKRIVSKSISAASKDCEKLFRSFRDKEGHSWACNLRRLTIENLGYRQILEYFDDLRDAFFEETLDSLYSIYCHGVQNALENLNNLYSRRDASYYSDLLKEEQEILRQIVKLQVAALENEIKGKTSAEVEIVEEAILILKETYQRESREIGLLDELFEHGSERVRENKGQISPSLENSDDFREEFYEIQVFSEHQPAFYEQFNSNFVSKYPVFKEKLDEYAGEIAEQDLSQVSRRATYFAKKAISSRELMSKEICDTFVAVLDYFNDSKEYFSSCEHGDIIKGIAETLSIKVFSINEGCDFYMLENERLLTDFSNFTDESSADTDILRKNILEGLLAWRTDSKQGAQLIHNIAESTKNSEQLHWSASKIEGLFRKKADELDKRALAYKREVLLYELTTFEEIIHYSVSRLRESVDWKVLEFVVEIDFAVKKIESILAKNGIERLSPLPHELFNPKEHEVLSAEQQADFKKGEIIKTINSGYRQNGTIIMRANVIAAK